jgi:hypothetical protein
MSQHLIVEGKDYFAIGELCKLHFPIPKGYVAKTQKEFLKGGKGFDDTLLDFINAFDAPNVTNLGLIVDANFKGVENRIKHILSVLSEKLQCDFTAFHLTNEGISFEYQGIKIGIWIMPNNRDEGYFEHFIEMMVDTKDPILKDAKAKVAELLSSDYCRFTRAKQQKAVIYSWLAWQETPGLPFGTAMKTGSLNRDAVLVKPFLNWIEKTFEF